VKLIFPREMSLYSDRWLPPHRESYITCLLRLKSTECRLNRPRPNTPRLLSESEIHLTDLSQSLDNSCVFLLQSIARDIHRRLYGQCGDTVDYDNDPSPGTRRLTNDSLTSELFARAWFCLWVGVSGHHTNFV